MKKIILVILASALFFTLAFAQEASKDRIFIMSDFSGGIATKLSDQSTPPKYARVAENIRLNSAAKAITKRDQLYTYGTADASEAVTGMHRLYLKSGSKYLIVTHGDELEVGNDITGAFTSILDLASGDYRWDFLTWHDLAIGGDGQNQPIKFDGTTPTYLGTCAAADAGSGAGPNGKYTYKVSFYTTSYEVIFDQASNPVTVTDNDISLTQIPIGPDTYLAEDIIGRKVYRSEVGGAGTYKLLTNGTIANNTATTLTDSDADGALGAAYPAGSATWTPPKGRFYLVHKNRLFIANNSSFPSRLYYSKDGSHDLFETSTDYFDIRQNDGDEITFIKNLLGILTVGKTNSIQKVYTSGDDPSADWEISDPFSAIGCDAPYTAKNTPIGLMYLSRSKSGIYVFNGQSSVLKSEQATPSINDILSSNLTNAASEYNNNVYYMTYASSAVGGSVNNRVLVYDMLADAYTVDTLNLNAFCSFTGGNDGGVLYSGASDSGKVYQFANTTKDIVHSKHSDFSGTFTNARYIPADVSGDPNSPILEMAWDCTIDGWAADILAKDATWDGTINNISVKLPDACLDRPTLTATYISPVLSTTGATAYDKFYWNETLHSGTDATFAFRSGATSAACQAAVWSSEYSVSAGSDISGLTAGSFTQYRLTFTTDNTDYSPYVLTTGGFTTKLSYSTLGTAAEAAIALHWQTGWLDFGVPDYEKSLRKLYVYLEGTSGILTITVTNEYGDSDTFSIDTSTYTSHYEEYFTSGMLKGRKFRFDVTNSDLNALKIKEIVVRYDAEPLV